LNTENLNVAELILEPADNNRLNLLCGPYDDNLKHIERRLLVDISYRDNRFKVAGPEVNVSAASDILLQLFQLTAGGRQHAAAISPEQVQ
jgi:phosphate starvation-inducible protein PhoH and related proteins